MTDFVVKYKPDSNKDQNLYWENQTMAIMVFFWIEGWHRDYDPVRVGELKQTGPVWSLVERQLLAFPLDAAYLIIACESSPSAYGFCPRLVDSTTGEQSNECHCRVPGAV